MMAKNIPKMPLPKLDDLFTTEEERTNDKLEKVIDIKISDIDDFPDHPFKVIENEDMFNMRDSIKENGVLVPALVRQKPDGRYEMVSGLAVCQRCQHDFPSCFLLFPAGQAKGGKTAGGGHAQQLLGGLPYCFGLHQAYVRPAYGFRQPGEGRSIMPQREAFLGNRKAPV